MSGASLHFGPSDMEWLARQMWGEPNQKMSTRHELRFGTKGGRSVKLKDRTWYDHDACEGGGYRDLYKMVFLCEGEKDADNLYGEGLISTTNIGGAGKWRPENSQEFHDKPCVILQDNDDAGLKHAAYVAQSLAGIAASVKVLLLPDLPEKGDVTDWLKAGGTRKELERLAREAPEYQTPGPSPPKFDFECTLAELQTMQFSDIKFVVPDFLPEGLTVFAGKPKIGKSWLMLGVALAVAMGTETLGKFVEQGEVLFCGLEDSKRRMRSRVEKILGPHVKDWPADFTFRHKLDGLEAGGMDTLEAWLIKHPNRRLIVIDTLAKVRGMKDRREEQYQYDYRLLGPLQELAARYNVAIVVIHHVNKRYADDVLDQISGTTGISGAADTCNVLGRTQHGVRFYVRGRDVEEQDKLMEFDPDTGLWCVLGDYDEAVPNSPTGGLKKMIFDLLANSPLPLSPIQIAERIHAERGTVRMILSRMVRADPPQLARNPDGS